SLIVLLEEKGRFVVLLFQPGQDDRRVRRCEDLRAGVARLGFQKLEKETETARMDAVLDLFQGDDGRHIGLEEGRRDGGETESAVGKDRSGQLSLALTESEQRFLQSPFQNHDVVQLYRCQLTKPR